MARKKQTKILRGIVTEAKRMEDFFNDEDGREWRKYIFSVQLSSFSKRMSNRKLPKEIEGRIVDVPRYCSQDWHIRVGRFITLTPEETLNVLKESKTSQ